MRQSTCNTSSDKRADLADPQEVAIVCHDGRGGWEPLAQLLSEAGTVRPVEYANLTEAFETAPDTPIVILLADPAETVARRMSEGEEPVAALAGWRAESSALLAACDRVRRGIVLLPAAADPTAAAAALVRHLDLAPLAAAEAVREQPAGIAPPSVLRVLADALLAADAEAREIKDSLEVRLLSLAGSDHAAPGIEGIGAACRAYLDLAGQGEAEEPDPVVDEEAARRIGALERDGVLLRETLAHAKAEFEALLTERGVLQKLADETGKRADMLQTYLSRSETAQEALQKTLEQTKQKATQIEGDYLRLQSMETLLKTDLASQRVARTEAEQLARAAREEAEALRSELAAAQSARVAAEELAARDGKQAEALREELAAAQSARVAAEELAARDGKQAEALRAGMQEELELTREALRLMKDELNAHIEARDRANADIDALKQERADLLVQSSLLAAHQAQLSNLRERSALRENVLGAALLEGDRDRADLRDEMARAAQAAADAEAGLQARIAALEAELTRVYGSRSWRITEPLRSTSSSLRGKPER